MKVVEINNREEWCQFFSKGLNVNLSQDWDYGRLNATSNNLQVKNFKIYCGDEVIAIYQTYSLRLKYLPLITIHYLNRGPIIINSNLTNDKIIEIIKLITDQYSFFKGSILYYNSFISNDIFKLDNLKNIFFANFFYKSYITSNLDLTLSIDELRKKLTGKWRNQLVKSEKFNYLEVDNQGIYLNIVIDKHIKMSAEKKFNSLNKNQLSQTLNLFIEKRRLSILVSKDMGNGEIEGYVCLIFIGKTALYYLGWSSLTGRKKNVSNFLLWHSVVFLKKKGVAKFDLGGYDNDLSPGIARFKKGMGGDKKEYFERLLKI